LGGSASLNSRQLKQREEEMRSRRVLIREDAIQRIYYQYDLEGQKKIVVEMKKLESIAKSWIPPFVLGFIGGIAGVTLWKYVLKGGP
jgi:hypothetical protein